MEIRRCGEVWFPRIPLRVSASFSRHRMCFARLRCTSFRLSLSFEHIQTCNRPLASRAAPASCHFHLHSVDKQLLGDEHVFILNSFRMRSSIFEILCINNNRDLTFWISIVFFTAMWRTLNSTSDFFPLSVWILFWIVLSGCEKCPKVRVRQSLPVSLTGKLFHFFINNYNTTF